MASSTLLGESKTGGWGYSNASSPTQTASLLSKGIRAWAASHGLESASELEILKQFKSFTQSRVGRNRGPVGPTKEQISQRNRVIAAKVAKRKAGKVSVTSHPFYSRAMNWAEKMGIDDTPSNIITRYMNRKPEQTSPIGNKINIDGIFDPKEEKIEPSLKKTNFVPLAIAGAVALTLFM